MTPQAMTLGLLALAGAGCLVDLARIGAAVIRARRAAGRFERVFWAGADLGKLHTIMEAQPRHPMASVFLAAMDEWRRSTAAGAPSAGAAARADRLARLAARRAVDGLSAGSWRLAAIATAAPLAGLAAGIMDQLPAPMAAGLALGALAVVAHHTAKALVAGVRGQLDGFAVELGAIIQRQAEAGVRGR